MVASAETKKSSEATVADVSTIEEADPEDSGNNEYFVLTTWVTNCGP